MLKVKCCSILVTISLIISLSIAKLSLRRIFNVMLILISSFISTHFNYLFIAYFTNKRSRNKTFMKFANFNGCHCLYLWVESNSEGCLIK